MTAVEWGSPGRVPPLSETLELPSVTEDLSAPPVVTYGAREDDPTTLACLLPEQVYVLGVGWTTRVWRYVPQRQAVYTAWRDRDGQQWGRRTWRPAAPRLEIVS